MPYLVGGAGVLFFWMLYGVFSGKWNPMELAKGGDGLPSSSKFQFLLWTGVIIFAYITIYVARAQQGEYGPIAEVPANLLVLMGISGGAMVISKGITVYNLSRGTATKSHETPKGCSLKYLICDDDGEPALNKLQMIAWTFIAIGIYLVLLTRQVSATALAVLPNVDDSLLVLMGISQGTYLGKRLVSTTAPNFQRLGKDTARSGEEVTLYGKNFGDEQAGSIVRIGDLYPSQIKEWKDDSITLILPQGLSSGTHNVSVIVGSKESNQLTINVVT